MAGRQIVDGCRRILALGAFLAYLVPAVAARAEAPRPEPKRFWMQGAYLSVEARSPKALLAGLTDAAEALKAGWGKQLRDALAKELELDGAAALDLIGGDRPVGLLLLNPRRGRGSYVFALGDDGMRKLVESAARLVGGGVPADLDLDEFMLGGDDKLICLRHVSPWVLGAADPGALDIATTAVELGRVPRAPAGPAQLALHLDMRELRAAFGDQVAGFFMMVRGAMVAAPMNEFGEGAPAMKRIIQAEIDVVDGIFKGFDELDASLRLSKESADLTIRALPASESVFAPLATEQKPARFVPARALPENGMASFCWNIERPAAERLVEALAKAMAHIVTGKPTVAEGAAGPDDLAPKTWTCAMHPQVKQPAEGSCPVCDMKLVAPESLESKYRKLLGRWFAGEDATFAGTGEGSLEGMISTSKDFDRLRDLYREAMALFFDDFAELYKAMGMGMDQKYEADVRRVNGRPVDRITVTYRGEGQMGEQTKLMMGAMMGGMDQVVEIASSGPGAVAAWGKEPAKVLDGALARAEAAAGYQGPAWPTASDELKALLERAPENTWLAGEMRFGSYMAFTLGAMAKAQPAMAVTLPPTEGLAENDKPVAFWMASERGRIVFRERIPMPVARKMVEYFGKMGERVGAGARPPVGPGGTPGPDELEEPDEIW